MFPVVLLATSCASSTGAAVQSTAEGRTVLVIVNGNSRDSLRLGAAYRKARGVPSENVIVLTTDTAEQIGRDVFDRDIAKPVKAALAKRPEVKYLLTTKGVPLRVAEGGYSVDSLLGAADVKEMPFERPAPAGPVYFAPNPYFGKDEAFSPTKFGYRIACRLDGYTVDDALALIQRGQASETGKGTIFLDAARTGPGPIATMNDTLKTAAEALRAKSVPVTLDDAADMSSPSEAVAGYATWGSNDGKWSESVYKSIKFRPGAIAETFVSTSGRTFLPTTGGQSLIADLIRQGVTGVKGYVSEPYTFALCRPEILFPRYISGYTLGESFAMASPVLKWKDVIIGDPLCRPYPKK